MPDPPASAGPRTLHEAKVLISRLRAQLAGHAKPVPKVDPQPTGGTPIPKTPPDPHPVPVRTPPINPDTRFRLDLSALAPKAFGELLERSTVKDLKALLSHECGKGAKEQDASVINKLYKEIKRRGL